MLLLLAARPAVVSDCGCRAPSHASQAHDRFQFSRGTRTLANADPWARTTSNYGFSECMVACAPD